MRSGSGKKPSQKNYNVKIKNSWEISCPDVLLWVPRVILPPTPTLFWAAPTREKLVGALEVSSPQEKIKKKNIDISTSHKKKTSKPNTRWVRRENEQKKKRGVKFYISPLAFTLITHKNGIYFKETRKKGRKKKGQNKK